MEGATGYAIGLAAVLIGCIIFIIFAFSLTRGHDPYPLMGLKFYKDRADSAASADFSKNWVADFCTDWLIGAVLPAAAVLFIIAGFRVVGVTNEAVISQRYASIQNAIDSGYELYVNGIKVEPEHITLENYSLSIISIHDESEEVHIAANN